MQPCASTPHAGLLPGGHFETGSLKTYACVVLVAVQIGVLEKVACLVHDYVGRVVEALIPGASNDAAPGPSSSTVAAGAATQAPGGANKQCGQAGKEDAYALPESDSEGGPSDMEEDQSDIGAGQQGGAAAVAGGSKAAAGKEDASRAVAGLLAEVRSLTDALIALTFKCPENQRALYSARVGPGSAQPTPTNNQQSKPTGSGQPEQAVTAAGGQPFLQSVLQLVATLSQPLRAELSGAPAVTGAPGDAQQSTTPASCSPPAWGQEARAECVLAWQSAADLLLNLTMNEPHCVAAAVEAGALELMGGCLAMFCRAAPAPSVYPPDGGGGAGTSSNAASPGGPAAQAQQASWAACRTSMLSFARPTTSAMCCLLNCINCTEADAVHVARFLSAALAPPSATHPSLPEPASHSDQGTVSTEPSTACIWGSKGEAATAARAVPLLCAILHAVHEDVQQGPQSSRPSAAGRAESQNAVIEGAGAGKPSQPSAAAAAAAAADAGAAAAATKTFGRGATRRSGGAPRSGAAVSSQAAVASQTSQALCGSQLAAASQPDAVTAMDVDGKDEKNEKTHAPAAAAPAAEEDRAGGGVRNVSGRAAGAGNLECPEEGEGGSQEDEQELEASWVRVSDLRWDVELHGESWPLREVP